MVEIRRELELSREDRADTRVFVRDLTTRMERLTEATIRAFDSNVASLRAMQADIRANTERTRAHAEAIFRMLDPPDGGGTAPA